MALATLIVLVDIRPNIFAMKLSLEALALRDSHAGSTR
jgi:hypothetical protein